MRVKNRFGRSNRRQHDLSHAVMTGVFNRALGLFRQRAFRVHPIPDTALDSLHKTQAAVAGNVGRFRRPRRNGAEPWHDEKCMLMRLARLSVCTVREQRIKLELLVTRRLTGKFSEMPELGADIGDTMFCECGDKFVLAKLGKRGGAAH